MSKKLKAIGFVRIYNQLETVAKSNIKLEAQKQEIAKVASSQDIEIVEWFSTVGSHYTFLSLQKALDYCKNNTEVKYLLVSNVSRISRSLAQLLSWETKFKQIGVTIKATDETKPTSTIEDSLIEDAYLCMVADHEHEVRLSKIEEAIRSEKAKEE